MIALWAFGVAEKKKKRLRDILRQSEASGRKARTLLPLLFFFSSTQEGAAGPFLRLHLFFFFPPGIRVDYSLAGSHGIFVFLSSPPSPSVHSCSHVFHSHLSPFRLFLLSLSRAEGDLFLQYCLMVSSQV